MIAALVRDAGRLQYKGTKHGLQNVISEMIFEMVKLSFCRRAFLIHNTLAKLIQRNTCTRKLLQAMMDEADRRPAIIKGRPTGKDVLHGKVSDNRYSGNGA
jgi:hypothetical protein